MARKNVANDIGLFAIWAVHNKKRFRYLQYRPVQYIISAIMRYDCSSFAALCYRVAGAGDPNGPVYHYNGWGNTETLANNGRRIPAALARPGDLAIFNVGKPLATQHVAVVVQKDGKFPLLVSMGQEGDPSFCRANQDPRPVTYYRYDTTQKWPALDYGA
jgi:hypothetical protein